MKTPSPRLSSVPTRIGSSFPSYWYLDSMEPPMAVSKKRLLVETTAPPLMKSLVLWFSLLTSSRAFPQGKSNPSLSSQLEITSSATPSLSCVGPLGCYRQSFEPPLGPTDSSPQLPAYVIAILVVMGCGIFLSVIISIVRHSKPTSDRQPGEANGFHHHQLHHGATLDHVDHHDQSASAPAQCTDTSGGGGAGGGAVNGGCGAGGAC